MADDPSQTLIFGYVRVSSTEQEDGYGPDVQANAIRAFAKLKGLPEPKIVYESESGESLARRVELRQAMNACKELLKADKTARAAIIFPKLDRLARELTDQESVVASALFHGYRLYSTVPAEDDLLSPGYAGDPMRVMIRQIIGGFAQLERTMIQGRLDGGLYEKAKQGGATGGRTPFGYKTVNQEIEVDQAAVGAVRACFLLESRGVTQKAIAAVVARDFPALCGHWGATQVNRVLARRELYAHGMYKPRLAVNATHHPELAILEMDATKPYIPKGIDLNAPVDWSKVPDPVALNSLALFLHIPPSWIQSIIRDLDLPATWSKGRMLIARDVARRIEPVAREKRRVS